MAKQILPSYAAYRNSLLNNEDKFPLKIIECPKNGLLENLSVSDDSRWPWNTQVNPKTNKSKLYWPKISVITPSYNQGKYLEKTIRSVLLQNYPNLEYIIIDGGSTDESDDIIKQYKNQVSFTVSEKDNGQSHAINKGFSLASGDIYCWLNSDDYFLPDTLFKVAKTFIHTKAKFVYGNGYNLINDVLQPCITGISFDRYLRIPLFNQPACFWLSSIHQPVWEDLHCSMDYELWVRIVKGNKTKYLNEFLAVALVHNEAKTHNPSPTAKAYWQADHLKEIAVHGEAPNWNILVKENHYIQKVFRLFPFLKSFF